MGKKYKGNLIDDLVMVHFHWSGNLGVLQTTTESNLSIASRLYVNDVINNTEYETLKAEILAYYKKGLESELKNPLYFG